MRWGNLGLFFGGLTGKTKDDFGVGGSYFIPYMNVYKNIIADNKMLEPVNIRKEEKQNVVKYGDILLTQSSETIEEIGLASVWIDNNEPYLNSFCFAFRLNKEGMSPIWFSYLMRSYNVRKLIMREGQGITRVNLSSERLKSVILKIPSLEEQEKIASTLSLLDSRIAAQHKLVKLLKKHKRGVQCAIFEGYLRIPCQGREHLAKWETIKIGNIFNERSERGGNADELLSVTINFGVRRQSDTEKKDSSSEDKGNYKRVVAGDIVYNTMRMWQGASGVSPWAGIVSPAYTVIYPKRNQNTIFWAYAFKHWRLIQTFQKFSQGLTSDTWNLKFPQLSDIRVKSPSIEEQNAIVDFLSKIDAQVTAEEKHLEKLKEMKLGFLQQLLV